MWGQVDKPVRPCRKEFIRKFPPPSPVRPWWGSMASWFRVVPGKILFEDPFSYDTTDALELATWIFVPSESVVYPPYNPLRGELLRAYKWDVAWDHQWGLVKRSECNQLGLPRCPFGFPKWLWLKNTYQNGTSVKRNKD